MTVSIILWIIITVNLVRILFKMSSVIIYSHNQLKSLKGIDFSCVFNGGRRSLIHNASAVFRFRLLLWKFLSIIFLKSTVLTFLCDFSMLCFKICDVWSLPLWFFILSVIWRDLLWFFMIFLISLLSLWSLWSFILSVIGRKLYSYINTFTLSCKKKIVRTKIYIFCNYPF